MEDSITLTEVRKTMQSGQLFSCEFITLNVSKRDGGEKVTLLSAKLLTETDYCKLKNRPLTPREKKELGDIVGEKIAYESEDWANHTRKVILFVNNIMTDQIREVRPLLITKFNGKNVL